MGSNDIKDKKTLIEQRKLIETEMERFKACEKEMKTKAYSREGLVNSTRLDPREKEKVETSNFVQEMLEELERQKEALEAEEETLHATMKKKSKDTSKQDRIAEIEDTLDRHKWHTGKLETILRMLENGSISPDAVNNLQDDIRYYVDSNQEVDFAEDDEIYDELNLDEEYAEGDSYIRDDTPSYSLEDLAENKDTPKESSARSSSTSGKESHKADTSAPSTAPTSATSSRKGSVVASVLSPITNTASHATPNILSSSISGMKPAPLPTRSTNELKYASAAAAGSANNLPPGLMPLPPSSAPATNGHAEPTVKSPPSDPAPSASLEKPSEPVREPTVAKPTSSIPEPEPSQLMAAPATAVQPEPPISKPSTTAKPATSTSSTSSSSSSSNFKLPPGLQDLIGSFEAARQRIGAPPPISSISKMLESSYLNCPDSFMANKPKYYQPETPFPTPACYPQEPLSHLNLEAVFSKMELDTLFYVFYYRQGTYQQALAARELKARSWRFHKKFLTWFQRHEEPKVINSEYEQGTYRYFDFEGMWLQRRKPNFKFEYAFLEDE